MISPSVFFCCYLRSNIHDPWSTFIRSNILHVSCITWCPPFILMIIHYPSWYIYIYTHLILLTASIIHHPIHILIYHPPSTSNLIVMEDVWHCLETGCNPISLFDTSRIPEGSRKVCSSCPLLHLGCQRCLLIILKELSLSSSSCFLGLLLDHCYIR